LPKVKLVQPRMRTIEYQLIKKQSFKSCNGCFQMVRFIKIVYSSRILQQIPINHLELRSQWYVTAKKARVGMPF